MRSNRQIVNGGHIGVVKNPVNVKIDTVNNFCDKPNPMALVSSLNNLMYESFSTNPFLKTLQGDAKKQKELVERIHKDIYRYDSILKDIQQDLLKLKNCHCSKPYENYKG